MFESRSKSKGAPPPEPVEELTAEELDGFSVEELLAGVQDVPDETEDASAEPLYKPPQVPLQARSAPAWSPAPSAAHGAPRDGQGSRDPRRGPVPSLGGGSSGGAASASPGGPDYRPQLDMMRHEMAQILARQFDDIDHRFGAVVNEMRTRLDLSEKTLQLTEEALHKREEEIARLRKENAIYRKKLKELAEVRSRLDEVFGG